MVPRNNEAQRRKPHNGTSAVAMVFIIAAVMLIWASCERKPVMSHASFVHLPVSGWHSSLPLKFSPQFDDSTLTYDITLTVRHDNSYRYSNLLLVVDMVTTDSTVSRQTVNMPLADQYGNWTGGGFGALYQNQVTLAEGVAPDDARSVVVWQAMAECDTLLGIADVGITIIPNQ